MGHFDFQVMNNNGDPQGAVIRIATDTGLILNSHIKCNPVRIRHLAEVARATPDYPVDLAAWDLYGPHKEMIWSARIYWRK